ncbi:hypothetical protein Gotur_021821 [Gossypium turneri]
MEHSGKIRVNTRRTPSESTRKRMSLKIEDLYLLSFEVFIEFLYILLLEQVTCLKIGNNSLVNFWNDVWLLGPGDGRVKIQNIDIRNSTISTVTLEAQSRLDLFGDEQVERILSIPLVNSVQTDEVIWRGDNTGAYTTKSGYKWLITEGENLLGSNNSMGYHERIKERVQDVVFINAYSLEIEQLRELSVFMHRPKCTSWEPSNGETVKVYFDASYQQYLHKFSLGIIVKNKEGLVMATCVYLWESVVNLTMAERRKVDNMTLWYIGWKKLKKEVERLVNHDRIRVEVGWQELRNLATLWFTDARKGSGKFLETNREFQA